MILEDCEIKKNVLTFAECNELANFFIEKSKTNKTSKGIRGYGENRRKFSTIDFQNRRTEWFEKVAAYRSRIGKAFGIEKYDDAYSWISIFFAPCDLPMHVDPVVKNYVRLIALLQKPKIGADVIISDKEHGQQKVLPLEVGDVYNLPAHRIFHGVTLMEEGQVPRVAMGFDFAI